MVRGFYNKAFHSFVMSTIPLLHLPDPSLLPDEEKQILSFRIIKEKEGVNGTTTFTTEFKLTSWGYSCDCYLDFNIPLPSYRDGYVKKGFVCIQVTVLGALAYHGLPPSYFATFYEEVLFPVLPLGTTFPDPSTFFSCPLSGVPKRPFPPSPFPPFSFLPKNEEVEVAELD